MTKAAERLRVRAEQLERREALQRILDAIGTMTAKETLKLSSRIMKDLAAGKITPAEANKLTKAVSVGARKGTGV